MKKIVLITIAAAFTFVGSASASTVCDHISDRSVTEDATVAGVGGATAGTIISGPVGGIVLGGIAGVGAAIATGSAKLACDAVDIDVHAAVDAGKSAYKSGIEIAKSLYE